jgi:hypothetical protein
MLENAVNASEAQKKLPQGAKSARPEKRAFGWSLLSSQDAFEADEK